ncbi:MAG TPA: beta-L-arabinofuranosidase domain-containing protein, partial [Pedobacter sp.]|nr:beta-L-arabinofuranosidase domain-containing protein [Pedobacter sp.]
MKYLLKPCFLLCLLFLSILSVGQDKLSPASSETIKGFIGQRLQNSYNNRILAQDADELIEPFKQRNETSLWQSEFWGKWFTSAVLAYKYQPTTELKQKLDKAVTGLMATQTPDGYIGNYKKENRLQQWDIWGRKYCMLGLLDYYGVTGDKKSLRAARAVADNLMADLKRADGIIVTKGNYRGMAASSILEPVCLLYKLTKDEKYLAFAQEIVKQWERPEGPHLISNAGTDVARRFPKPADWYSFEQGQKAYEMMSCYEGLLELYRLTGKKEYKTAVERAWQNIFDTEINVAGSGASTEMWFGGRPLQTAAINHYQETCVTVTWIKLSHQLLRLTGEAKYADAVETSYYNALLGAMSADGRIWAKYTPLTGHRLPGSGQCGMHINCCDASGPRGLFNLPAHVVMKSGDGVYMNYYAEGSYSLSTPTGKMLKIAQ